MHALARARFPDDAERLAFAQGVGHAVDGVHGAALSVEGDGEVLTSRRGALSWCRSCPLTSCPLPRVEGVAQAVAEQVEGQHREKIDRPGQIAIQGACP